MSAQNGMFERVRDSFAKQGIMRLLSAKVTEAGEGRCQIKVPYSAGGYAALTLAPEDREVVTVEYKINFVAPAWGEKLVARGEVLTSGGRLFVCKAEVFAVSAEGEETLCAALQQTIATTSAQT